MKLFWVLGFAVSVALGASGCATVGPGGGPAGPGGAGVVEGEPREMILRDLCVRYGLRYEPDNLNQVITLKYRQVEARVMVNSDIVFVNNAKITLSRPVWISRGVVYVPSDFKTQVVNPLFAQAGPSRQKFRKIMIDAGHGGKDPGGIGRSGTQEKDVVLDIAKRVARSLEAQGIAVVLSRSSDEFLTLEERAALAHKNKVDLFVSIHANIERSHEVRGVEVYRLTPLDYREKKEFYQAGKFRDYFDHLNMRSGDGRLEKTLVDMLYVHKQYESERLSRRVARELAHFIQTDNRGSKSASFSVLRNTLVPAILIEVGFLSHRTEEQELRSGPYRQEIADGLAKALSQYGEYYD